MSPSHPHLTTATAELLANSDSERITLIREERWITFPGARLALEALNALLTRPRTTRMRSIAIYADSGMGKTMLMDRFKRANPSVYSAAERRSVSPVVALQMPSHATERRFYAHLLSVHPETL